MYASFLTTSVLVHYWLSGRRADKGPSVTLVVVAKFTTVLGIFDDRLIFFSMLIGLVIGYLDIMIHRHKILSLGTSMLCYGVILFGYK